LDVGEEKRKPIKAALAAARRRKRSLDRPRRYKDVKTVVEPAASGR
jgi:hypothetical protein